MILSVVRLIRSLLGASIFLFPYPVFFIQVKMACRIKTNKDLFELFRKKFVIRKTPQGLPSTLFLRSVPIRCTPDFREAIAICLQEILDIEKLENLSPLEVVKFEEVVSNWYKNVPMMWKLRTVSGHYEAFKKHHANFLSREVHLGENTIQQTLKVINLNTHDINGVSPFR